MAISNNLDESEKPDGDLFDRSNRILGIVGVVLFLLGVILLRTDFEIAANGTVTREDEYTVYSPAIGIVKKVNLREGQQVQKGDIILELDSNELELRLLSKRRELAALEFQLASNQLALKEFAFKPASVEIMVSKDKGRLLSEISDIQKDLVARWEELERNRDVRTIELQQERIEQLRLDLEQLETTVQAQWLEAGAPEIDREKLSIEQIRLRREIELVRSEITLLETEVDALSLRAPIGGRLTRLDIRYPGAVAEKGQPLFTVADPASPYLIEALVPERNVDLIRPGTKVRMESQVFDSMFEGYIHGTVQSVSPDSMTQGYGQDGPSQFEVEIRVDETPLPLVLGSRLKTYFVIGQRSLWELLVDRRSQVDELRHYEAEGSGS